MVQIGRQLITTMRKQLLDLEIELRRIQSLITALPVEELSVAERKVIQSLHVEEDIQAVQDLLDKE